MKERAGRVVEEIEQESAPKETPPGQAACEGDGGKERQKPVSPLQMLLREAEIIAQNLKQSGTRR